MNNQQPGKKSNNIKKRVLAAVLAGLGVALVVTISYKTLSKLKEQELIKENAQEQFAGIAQVSEQLQAECQKSAEKISSLNDATLMFEEYKQKAENCREAFFAFEKKSQLRSEGMYPDLIVDIAVLAAKTNKAQAVAMLNFSKSINAWEFYMGPIVCSSKATIEAYLESLNPSDNKICFKLQEDKEKLYSEIKNKNFSVLSKSLSSGRVVSIGSPESETGCPGKISAITKIVQDATVGNLSLEVEQIKNSDTGTINFVFKTKTEDKIILVFAVADDCLQLQAILIPNLPANE